MRLIKYSVIWYLVGAFGWYLSGVAISLIQHSENHFESMALFFSPIAVPFTLYDCLGRSQSKLEGSVVVMGISYTLILILLFLLWHRNKNAS
ncbi:hypothetical protein BTJ40_16400 [Microbulbifer sp. A4B17]|uniref:hypothetical protein n=1 Tax=Microbulbifer sp. A4B17 TaxID=359370 RepID=UPI000D52EE17|nr:hypothetical protein [Microbulbifer sp. A4B17]AWF82280.1 hypothetical protein BTJ40_16400 [Microbulbifer sp. A4B17]